MLTTGPFDGDEDEMSDDVTVHGESTVHTGDDKSDIATGLQQLLPDRKAPP